MHKWQLKYAMVAPFMQTAAGAALYDWLTARLLGTQVGMSRKWCYWFREHMVLSRRFGRISIPNARVWLFEPGWSLAPTLLTWLVTGRGPLVTERKRRIADRYLSCALDEVKKSVAKLARIPDFDSSLMEERLKSLLTVANSAELLSRCEAEYVVDESLDLLPTGAADLCLSMGRLEHFSEHDLQHVLRQMHRVLRPGGIGSHIVDHRDHFWHFDKSIHCFNHLTMSDKTWTRIAKKKLYRNRLLEPDYVRLFQSERFSVLAKVHELHRQDARGVNPDELWGPFKSVSAEALEAAVSHFIVKRI